MREKKRNFFAKIFIVCAVVFLLASPAYGFWGQEFFSATVRRIADFLPDSKSGMNENESQSTEEKAHGLINRRIDELKQFADKAGKNYFDFRDIRWEIVRGNQEILSDLADVQSRLRGEIVKFDADLEKSLAKNIDKKLDEDGGTLDGKLTVEDGLIVKNSAKLSDVLPRTGGEYDLGSSVKNWHALYVSVLFGGSGGLVVGDGSSLHSLSDSGDLIVSGNLEVSELAYLDSGADLNGQSIVNLADPVGAQDAVTKAYADSMVGGSSFWSRTGATVYPLNAGDNLDMLAGDIVNAGTLNGIAPADLVVITGSYSDPAWLVISKTKVGLGSVENTAISTWAGSANLTTLGTVTAGVWQGTAIADSYIASAAAWNAKQGALGFTPLDIAGSNSMASNLQLSGYTLLGSTTAGGNLTLQSTAHATKGKILFGTSAYDEVNNRLGIGTTSPGAALEIASIANPGLIVGDGTTGYLKIGGSTLSKISSGALMLNSGLWVSGQVFANINSGGFNAAHLLYNSATSAIGNGASLNFYQRDTNNSDTLTSRMGGIMTSNTAGSASGALVFYTGNSGSAPSEKLRIDSLGNVGIGTTSPGSKLEIIQATDTLNSGIRIANSAITSYTRWWTAADNKSRFDVGASSQFDLIVNGGGTGRFGIQELVPGSVLSVKGNASIGSGYSATAAPTDGMIIQGNVGIGTTSPSARLAVVGSGTEATYGSNLTTNGDFATGDFTGWTAGANWSVVSNAALHTAGSTATLAQNITVASGTTYQIEWTDTGGSAGTYTFSIGGVVSRAHNYWEEASSKRTTIVASGSGSQAFTITPSSTYNGSLDNITVRAVTAWPSIASIIANADGTSSFEVRSGGTGLNNIFLGSGSGSKNTTGYSNSAQGASALYYNTTGYQNSAQGVSALYSNTAGYYNSAQGVSALYSNTTGYQNSAQGVSALYSNTTGYQNSAQGVSALYYNTAGYYNSAQGVSALYSNTAGYYNSAQGASALYSNTTGYFNSAQGVSALYSNTTGY
jgi:hypothetical protein